jgi:flagellar hook-length control protein FliK
VAGLSGLVVEVEEEAHTDSLLLETSALPFLATLLNDLGLPKDVRADIINKADQGEKGISLDLVMEELRQIQNRLEASGQSLQIQNPEGGFERMLSQLNMPVETVKGAEVTLNDILAAFESYKMKKQGAGEMQTATGIRTDLVKDLTQFSEAAGPGANQSMEALVSRFFESLSLADETAAPSFSFNQIKDQFATDLMIPAKGKNDKKVGLFAQKAEAGDIKPAALFKAIESVLSKNSDAMADPGKKGDKASFANELKSEIKKGEALFQGTLETKTNVDGLAAGLKAKSAQRPLPAYVTQQVGRGIVRAMNQGETSLKLTLKPAELGRLSMTIDNLGSSIKVTIVTENQAARDMLASNVNELKSALSSAGISLDSFDVDMNSDFRQSMANAGNQAGQFGSKNSNKGNSTFAAEGTGGSDEMPLDSEGLTEDGSYHFVA